MSCPTAPFAIYCSRASATTERGSIGAFWRTIDGSKGGFFVCPKRSGPAGDGPEPPQRAVTRLADRRIYAYWQAHVGVAGKLMIDPQQHADTLFQVAAAASATRDC